MPLRRLAYDQNSGATSARSDNRDGKAAREYDLNFPFPGAWNAWGVFLIAYHVVEGELDAALRRNDELPLTEFAVLYFLYRSNGRLCCSDLAEKAILTSSRVTRHLDKLEARGYILREPDPSDRRVIYAVLTAVGYEAYQKALATFAACYEKHFASLISEEDRPTFIRLMGAIAHQPRDLGDSPKSKPGRGVGRN